MYQEFDRDNNVHINRDNKGIAFELIHYNQPFVSQARTPQLAAAEYLGKYGKLLGFKVEEIKNLGLAPEKSPIDVRSEFRFESEKQMFDMTTVTYQQTYFGLPVWNAGVSINMKQEPLSVVSSRSTSHADLTVKQPTRVMLDKLKKIDNTILWKLLGLSPTQKDYDKKTFAIGNSRLIIYRYEAAKRIIAGDKKGSNSPLQLPLPAVPKSINEGQHYVSAEVHFMLAPSGFKELHWVVIIEAETLAILYLRAFISDVNGLVFPNEPMTDNGGPAPSANNAALNPVRVSLPLDGLTIATPQTLTGNYVHLSDVETPTIALPVQPPDNFNSFDARTDNFAAVNAYYHCDRFFRMMNNMGFNTVTYFGSIFPTPVDHRGHMNTTNGIEVNAHCLGTSGGLAILRTTFALADTTDTAHPLGMACDYRVTLHELGGHGVLYSHVHSPNYGFAHSAGDSIAVITCDPDSHAYNTANPTDPNRFISFPWVLGGRRHDRAVSTGWGWSGNIGIHPFDSTLDSWGYNNEQILSTTLFRFYRSIGGDAAELAKRQFVARYAVYLILRAIGTLTPATNPPDASHFADALMNADLGDWTSEGHAGGVYGKVIRWAFEKQGLYQPAGTPTPNNNEGAPPAVDVYIEDGRHGEYQYQPNHWSCGAIWNRRQIDTGTTHEEPYTGQTNYAWVKIKNRGTTAATNVIVKAYHAKPGIGLVYPNDWEPMTPAQLPAANVPPNNSAEITVGPFEWVPSQVGHECMFMVVSADGDPSNISNMTAGDSIPEWRLVPNDNNIGQRNVFPTPGGGGLQGIFDALDGLQIQVKNPHNVTGRTIIKAELPQFLVKTGWAINFTNPGGDAFSLRSHEMKQVVLKLSTGKQFTAEDVRKAKDRMIHIKAYANGIVVGGMSYVLEPTLKAPFAKVSPVFPKPPQVFRPTKSPEAP